MTTVTVDDVKRIHAGEVLKGLSARQAYNSTRTLVQLALHEAAPSPYPLDPPTALWIRGRQPRDAEKALGIPLHVGIDLTPEQEKAFDDAEREELAQRREKLALSCSPEHHKAHIAHNARAHMSNAVRDGVHFAQKMHQAELWRQTDALVQSAIGGAP